MNSKKFCTLDAVAYGMYTVSSPYTFLPIFDLWKEDPIGRGLGFYSLVLVCVRVCLDFRTDFQVSESAWSPSVDSSLK